MSASRMPEAGESAPDFTGTTTDGESIRLSDLRGRPVVLYFYPKDDTPGCTRQACSLRDRFDALTEAGIEVLGVSPDDVASHQRFASKFSLPFKLVADPDHEIQHAYGVRGPKSMYGKLFDGLKRTTFLIGEDGVIRHVFKKPNTTEHAEEVLKKWREVQAADRRVNG